MISKTTLAKPVTKNDYFYSLVLTIFYRERKLADDMTLASVNDTVRIMKSQLSERDSEIVQLGNVIKQKEEDLAKASAGIQEIIGARWK